MTETNETSDYDRGYQQGVSCYKRREEFNFQEPTNSAFFPGPYAQGYIDGWTDAKNGGVS